MSNYLYHKCNKCKMKYYGGNNSEIPCPYCEIDRLTAERDDATELQEQYYQHYLLQIKLTEKALAERDELRERLLETHDWQCGCGHWNGCNLPFCANCGRKPNER